MRSSPESIVNRVSSVPNVVPSTNVSERPLSSSSASAWTSQVMRVSVPPTTSLPEPVLGRAVIFAVSSAWAVEGTQAPAHTKASATARAQASFWSIEGSG